MKKIQKLFKEFYNRICGYVRGWLQHLESSKTFSLMTNHKYINILYYVMFLNSIGCLFFFKESNILLLFSFVYFLFSLYLLLYAFLDIPKSILSFISFIFNFVIGCLYLRGLYFLLYKGFDVPIFVEDLTLFSQYRYLFMLILYISGLVLFLISLKYNELKNIFSTYNLSFLKKKFINVIQACPRFELILNKICSYVLDSLIDSSYFRVVYFCLHFFVNYLYRIFILLFFINFCFFHGDLLYVLYFLLVSFFFWVYSFAAYYFSWVFDDNFYYVRDIFSVTMVDNNAWSLSEDNYFCVRPSNLVFKLTPYALKRNYTEEDIPQLKKAWYQLSDVQIYFDNYNRKFSFISYVIICLYFICWLNICYNFFLMKSFS